MNEVPISEGDIKDSSAAEAEGQTHRLEELLPGDVIRFADITELTAFEDMLAGVVEPKHDPELWAARFRCDHTGSTGLSSGAYGGSR
jgi:hypothetical protein